MRFENDSQLRVKSKEQSEKLLRLIFAETDLIQFQTIKGKDAGFIKHWTIDQFLENVEQFQNLNDQGYNVYFGINARDEEAAKEAAEKSGEEPTLTKSGAVIFGNAAFIDIDSCEVSEGREQVEAAVGEFPTADWMSGGGYQAVYVFDGPVPITSWKAIQSGLIQNVEGLDSTIADPPQLARLPGFFNVKAKYGPDFPFSEIAHLDDGLFFRPEDFPQCQVFENEVVESSIEVPDGYLSKAAKAFLEDGTLPASDNGEPVGRRQMAFRVACEAKASNIDQDKITEQIVEACASLDLDLDDLDDLPRQVNNAYKKDCLPKIDEEDLPTIKLPEIDRTPKLNLRPTKNGWVATVRVGGEPFVNALNIEKEKDRAKFVEALQAKWPDEDFSGIESDLMKAAAGDSDEMESTFTFETKEIEAGHILRPESFYVASDNESIVGITIPVLMNYGPAWMSYLKKGDQRTAEPLNSMLECDGIKYMIQPDLYPPVEMEPTWGRFDRMDWIDNGNESLPPDEIFKRIILMLKKFLDMPEEFSEEHFELLGVYVALTYQLQHFYVYPYLQFCGPKGSGKSRVLETMKELVCRPVQSTNVSPSAMFRELDQLHPTLLFDEAEFIHFADHGPWAEVRSMFLAGYRRGGKVKRCQGDDHVPTPFAVDGFKILGSINEPDETLGSRCIITLMERCSINSEKTSIAPFEAKFKDDFQSVRDALFRFTMERADEIFEAANADVLIPKNLLPRSKEIWSPILKMAAVFEKHGIEGLSERLRNLSLEKQDEHSTLSISDIDLAILKAAVKLNADYLLDPDTSTIPGGDQIAQHATFDSSIGDISARKCGPVLRRYRFRHGKVKQNGKQQRGWFIDASAIFRLEDRHQLELLTEDHKTQMREKFPHPHPSRTCPNVSNVSQPEENDDRGTHRHIGTRSQGVGVEKKVSVPSNDESFELESKPKPKRKRKAKAPVEEMIQPGEVEL